MTPALTTTFPRVAWKMSTESRVAPPALLMPPVMRTSPFGSKVDVWEARRSAAAGEKDGSAAKKKAAARADVRRRIVRPVIKVAPSRREMRLALNRV
jgi:hypothetical protein